MKENIEKTKQTILAISQSSTTEEEKLLKLNDLLGTLNPLENANELDLLCNVCILYTNKLGKTEMTAQFYFIKAKAEVSRAGPLIHEMKNLTLGLGWFAFARKSEKDRHAQLEQKVQEIWTTTQEYLNAGFVNLNVKPYIIPTAYCQKTAGEVYGAFYLQQKLYLMTSGNQPWRATFSILKIVRFLDLDDVFSMDKKSRKRVNGIKSDCLRCLKEALKYYAESKTWEQLAECYIVLGLEHHSFNSPVRSRIALWKAERLIKKHKIQGLDERLKSIKTLPLIGSDRDKK